MAEPTTQRVDLSNREQATAYFQALPGFVLRRSQQILSALFAAECSRAGIDVTESQLDALIVIASSPHIDQVTLARKLGYDRSTTTSVVNGLVRRGLVKRLVGTDRRRRLLEPTPSARAALSSARRCSSRADAQLLAGLSPSERHQLLQVLTELATRADTEAPAWESSIDGAAKTRGTTRLPKQYLTPRFLMGRCSQIGNAFLMQALGETGLTAAQLGVMFLTGAWAPVDQTAIGRALRLDKSSVSLILSSLQLRGLIRRRSDPRHGRRVQVSLTPKGSRQLNESVPRAAGADARVFEGLSSGARERFCSLLGKVVEAHRDEPESPSSR